jgi:predicted transcriptional regulator of viral defense system
MREQLTPLRAADIEQALGLPPVRMTLQRMADAGVLERVAKGVYRVPEDER